MSRDENSDVPPLEDMTEQIPGLKAKLQSTNPTTESDDTIFHPLVPPTETKTQPPQEELKTAPKPAPKKPSSGFAKGFLLGSKKPAAKVEDLSHIKAKPKEDSLKLSEIEALKKQVTETQNQWMTPDLLKEMWSNEKIRTAMSDPMFLQAIEMMKTEPKKAMELYGKYPHLVPTLMEFNKIMSGHMEKMKKEQIKKEDPGAYAIEYDEEVKEIIKDEKVQRILMKLQKEGKLELHEIMQKDPVVAKKLQTLIAKKVLNVHGA